MNYLHASYIVYLGRVNIRKNKYNMKQFKAQVKASGMYVETIVFANSVIEAQKILQAQFGVAI